MASDSWSKRRLPPLVIQHEVQHIKQMYTWDCGIACIMMLLDTEQREHMLRNFKLICQEEGFGQSTWTIDLCYLLKRFNIRHHMYTVMVGVNEDHRKHKYYNKIIDTDKERVMRRFDEAPAAGIHVGVHRLSMEDIVWHLTNVGPVIVLVDAGLLVCDLCKHNKLKAEFRRCFGGSYRGHYVLLVGCVARVRGGSRLLYRDPALAPRLCRCTPSMLAAARAAPGTDHDLLLLYTH